MIKLIQLQKLQLKSTNGQLMLKFIKVSFVIIFAISLNGCKCYYYYSNDTKSAIIKEDYFEMEARINSQLKFEDDQLEIGVYFKDTSSFKVIKNSLKIYPIVVGKKDTLRLINEYASNYYFEFNYKRPVKIDIALEFDLDSLGVIIHKSILFKNLNRNKDCEFRPVMH